MSIEHEPICESCGHHRASYRLDYNQRGRFVVEPFLVCWICMTSARKGPRRPFVTILTAEDTA